MTKQIRYITLGCKVNQYETQAMREALENAGFDSAPDPRTFSRQGHRLPRPNAGAVDFVVINTCTVTKQADRENIYWIRRARREHPEAGIIVTGCFVERNHKEIASIPEVDLIVFNHEKSAIANRIAEGCGNPGVRDDQSLLEYRRRYSPLSISRSAGKGRAFVKIQDGCNHACTFCKVVLVRGRSRSRSLSEIVSEARRLSGHGYREIVLTGIQLGAYGLDFSEPADLRDVMEACAEIDGIERIRLSSIEPTDIKPELIEAMARIPKCCPHLHVPLQSGDDTVLERMNRRYRRDFYMELAGRLRSVLPNFTLTLDVMAGFPGEEESHFEQTVQLLESVKPLKSHVFPYSLRPGTRAAGYEQCREEVIRSRVARLIQITDSISREVRSAFIGSEFPVLAEKETGRGRLLQGLTPNYLKVCFQGPENGLGAIYPVKLLALEGDVFLGRIV